MKRTLHISSKIWILCSRELEHKIHIFSPPCNILYTFKLSYAAYAEYIIGWEA